MRRLFLAALALGTLGTMLMLAALVALVRLRPLRFVVRTLAAALGIRYRAQPDGTFNHTSALILLDRDGRIVARSEVTGLQPDPHFVATVRAHLGDASASAPR